MQIPLSWIKENFVINKENFSLEFLTEKLNYSGLECQELLEKNTSFINFTTFPNRKDMNNWWGIAKEISSLSGLKMREFEDIDFENFDKVKKDFTEKENKKKFFTFFIENVKKESSPEWLKDCLRKNSVLSEDNAFFDLLSLTSIETGKNFGFELYSSDKKDNIFQSFIVNCFNEDLSKCISILKNKEVIEILINNLKKFLNYRLKDNFKISFFENEKIFSNNIKKQKNILLKHKYIEKKMGISFSKEKVIEIFKKLDFEFFLKNKSYEVQIPFYRKDILEAEDLIEEIGKIFDYNKVPGLESYSLNEFFENVHNINNEVKKKVSNYLVNIGFQEVETFSLKEDKHLIEKDEHCFSFLNSKGKKNCFYRNFIFPDHLEVFNFNAGKGIENIFIFEISRIYSKKNNIILGKDFVSIFGNGKIFGEKVKVSIFKKIIDNIFKILGIDNENIKFLNKTYYEGVFDILLKDEKIGLIGSLENVSSKFKKTNSGAKDSFFCEFDLSSIIERFLLKKKNEKEIVVKKSQLLKKDISFFIPTKVNISEIVSLIRKNFTNDILLNLNLVDIYKESSDSELHSLCFSIEFVLKKEEVNSRDVKEKIDSIFVSLEKNFSNLIRR